MYALNNQKNFLFYKKFYLKFLLLLTLNSVIIMMNVIKLTHWTLDLNGHKGFFSVYQR